MLIRTLDILLSVLGLLFGLPLLLIIAMIGLWETGSPIFRQTRVGRNQTPFALIKFRTMRIGTPSVATHLASTDSITATGRFLRRTKLDELPQLWNVLKGDMSLVGPRPCLFNQDELIRARQKLGVFDARPGITGLAQISRIDMSTPQLLAETDAQMLESLTLTTYFRIIMATITGKGSGDNLAYSSDSPFHRTREALIRISTRNLRETLILLFDLIAMLIAWYASFLLRFNFDWPTVYTNKFLITGLLLLLIHAASCRLSGLYRGIWVFASLPDLKRVLKAVGLSTLALIILIALERSEPALPRSLIILYPMLLLLIMGGGRAAWRMWKEHRLYGDLLATGKPVVIVGAGRGGVMLARELERSPDWRVVGFLDDEPDKWGKDLYGHPVIGGLETLPRVLEDFKAKHVILAMPSAESIDIKRAADQAVRLGAHVFRIPGLKDLMNGKVSINAMRPIEIEDLLGRDAVVIDTAHIHQLIANRRILISGAGGSIGSELCRQLVRFNPTRLILVENNELALYNIEQWLSQRHPEIEIIPLAGDVKDQLRLNQIFESHRPQLVFHAAAYKHVPLMEVGNAWEAFRNNVLGTYLIAEHAQRYGAERFLLISTDKAVNPTNVMGATKRLAEMVCQALSQRHPLKTQFEIVRFGNVLGSTGSVIPKFSEQIAHGGPVTVTHPEITRYFMSIPEAAQLVLQAATMGTGGEIFVLDMGQPVKIVDLAKNMIRLSGYTEDDIRIEYTGLRPGEKLYEELLSNEETTKETHHPKLRIAKTRNADDELLDDIERWLHESTPLHDDEVRQQLKRWVPEYQPSTHPAPST